ncbi:ArsA-related P-loop ATPase (plasmid) [Escherichia coli]|nr:MULTISPECIES: ArsA-related P-loop ATPase [Enterobacteriaceae]MDV1009911.1 ArsA-related P-loop ATPase [Klebsiella pneumoniae]MDV1032170.1 ArsA-related P-loop ATPase [Klebsiella pneumoniae]MDY2547461.1 ArsA-related P-loop ATPase [Salmonella enterica subsp. enterica serovar Bareilly]
MSGGHMKFLENIPSYLFFTGKGGVGKTSISCATAIRLAELGKRVLLVSTDPASNVGQVAEAMAMVRALNRMTKAGMPESVRIA